MKTARRQSAVRLEKFGRAAGLMSAGLLLAFACKSFQVDENVYTGPSVSARAGSSSSGVGFTSPDVGGSTSTAGTVGNAGSSGTSAAQGGGDVAANAGATSRGGASSVGGTSGEVEPEPDEPFSKAALLRQVADCAIAQYADFADNARHFEAAAKANVAAPTPTSALELRNAWLAANSSWQVAEVFRFGPAARSADADPGAQELRDQIYAWRFGGRCPVETALADQVYASPTFGTSLINNRGLGAAEYLLFYPGTDNECPDYSAINKQGTWVALGADEIISRKRAYAAAIAADVLANAEKLIAAWDPAAGNFRRQLSQPGSGSVYKDEQTALNAVFFGMFYIEKEVKDYKIGIPVGANAECVSGLCPEAIESRYANVSTANIRRNYLGFRRLFQGCGSKFSGLGFDDWLDAVGASELRIRMLSALDGAQAAIDALDPPLEVSVTAHTDRVFVVYNALKVLTDLIKSDFVTVLDLELPIGAGTDND
ncbi:MAG: imelysin family protein [Polyangiaceae bacterium]